MHTLKIELQCSPFRKKKLASFWYVASDCASVSPPFTSHRPTILDRKSQDLSPTVNFKFMEGLPICTKSLNISSSLADLVKVPDATSLAVAKLGTLCFVNESVRMMAWCSSL